MKTKTLIFALLVATGTLLNFQAAVVTEADLYVTGPHDVLKIAPDGTITTVVSGLSTNGMYDDLANLVIDSSGNLFVANRADGIINKITPNGTVTIFASGLSGPSDLVFNSSGDLFVANVGGTISKITPDGTVSTFASGLNTPDGLVFDSAGNLFVGDPHGDFYKGTISKITPDGTVSQFATGLINPIGLAFDSHGTLFVSNYDSGIENSVIDRIAPDGTVSTFASASGIVWPRYLVVDSSNNLFVSGLVFGVTEYAPDGTTLGSYGVGTNFVSDYWGVAFAPVPEPSTCALLELSLLMLVMVFRKRTL